MRRRPGWIRPPDDRCSRPHPTPCSPRGRAGCLAIRPVPSSTRHPSTRLWRPMFDEALRDLAQRAGVAVEWHDYAGNLHVVSPDVLRHILEALGLRSSSRGDVVAARRLLQRRSSVVTLPPLITATAGRPTRLDVGA